LKALFDELRRRNVLRAGAAYLVSAWLIAQVADLLTDAYDAPGWVMRTVLGVLGLGFPAAVLLAWAYEFTPRGLERDADVPSDSPTRARTSRRLDRAIIALLTIALLYFAIDKIWLSTPPPSTSAGPTLAVLPFDNIGTETSNEVLADGIPETLLTMFTQVPALRVIGRTSSFSFKGQGLDPASIGRQLGASVVLTGSVQRAGDRLRISASLISSADGAQLWAEKFDGSVDDVFAMQDEVAQRVLEASKVTLSGDSGPGSVGTHNFAAYELLLRAFDIVGRRDAVSTNEGTRLLEQATALDPTYGQAWSLLAWTLSNSGDLDRALEAARKGVDVSPEAAQTHMILSQVLRITQQPGADAELERALALAPQNSGVLMFYAGKLRLYDDQYVEAADVLRKALLADPRNAYMRQQAGMAFDAVGDAAGALAQFHAAMTLDPESAYTHLLIGEALAHAVGRRDESLRFYRKLLEIDPSHAGAREALARGYAAIGADDLARREIAGLREYEAADDYLWLRAEVESLWDDDSAAQELKSQVFAGDDVDSGDLLLRFDETGMALEREEARRLFDDLDRTRPAWYENELASDDLSFACLLEQSGDHERASTLLEAAEPAWRKRIAYTAFTGRAGRGDQLARALACTGHGEAAIMELEKLVGEGYDAGGWRRLMTHPAYQSIRRQPGFEAIVARLHTIADEERTRFLARPDLQPSDIDLLGELAL